MPPFEMIKMLLVRALSKCSRMSWPVTVPSRARDVRKIMFVDVSKAHLYALIDADVDAFVELPSECRKEAVCGRFNHWMCGMRPASKGWGNEYSKRLLSLGFIACKASPCCFRREKDGVSVVVPGDGFVFEGPAGSFPGTVESLKKYWIVKIRATLGPEAADDKEVSILNRVVRWDQHGVEYEADPRHVEKLLRDMGMMGCKPLSSPGVKLSAEEMSKESAMLEGDAITQYRSGVARCNYLCVDRPDIPFESNELCRAMSRPTESDMTALKHLCRYLKGRSRLVQRIPGRGTSAWELQVYVDTDWAGCRKTRKSTNGGCMVLNGACLKTWSTIQVVRAVSSAEAEYYAALKDASMALGFRSMAADLGEDIKIVLWSDSAAALGVIGRQGLGKLRHLEMGYLWLQDVVADKRMRIQKVKGTENPADLGTKHFKADDIDKHLRFLKIFSEPAEAVPCRV